MGNSFSDTDQSQLKVENYAGDVTPGVAWQMLEEDEQAVLVDVRTPPEWAFVGVAALSSLGKEVIYQQWRLYPKMEVNENFVEQVLAEKNIEKDAPILFLCRSGGRSLDAAIQMTKHGFTKCYNIAGGFEGDLDENGHRATTNGWKNSNLPWEQR